jgi:tetratricopeptide (TPR) repeat protein
VIGDVFWEGAVAAALDEVQVGEAIRTLRTRGFVDEEEETAFPGDRQLKFHHNLIREVVYDSLPKSERSRMHRKVADWLEPRTPDRPDLWVGIAHHLDRALTLGAEVAVFEQPDPVLPDATANAYLRAAEWTSANAALPEAASMLRRAVEVAASSEVAALCRARLAYTLALAGEADEAILEADAVASGKAPTEAAAVASLARAQAAYDRGLEGIGKQATSALRLARDGSLRQVEARALELLAWHDFWTTETTPEGFRSMERLLREAAEAAFESGDLGPGARVTGLLSALLATVPLEIGAAESLAEEGMRLAQSSGSPRAMAMPKLGMAFVRMHQDRLEEAAELGREMLRLSLECGEKVNALAACAFVIGRPLRLLGRHEESLEILERGLALSREVGEAQYEPNVRMERALTMLELRRIEDAEQELAGVRLDDHSDWMIWTSALADVRAAQGRDEEAERLWREVLERPWGALKNDAVEAAVGLARFLAGRGRGSEARTLLDQARSWLEGTPAPLLERQIRESKRHWRRPRTHFQRAPRRFYSRVTAAKSERNLSPLQPSQR